MLITPLALFLSLINIVNSLNFNRYVCPNTSTNIFSPNSTFQFNRDRALSSLISNATFSLGFYNVTFGHHDSLDAVVYASFFCGGNLKIDICQECVVNASKVIIQNCPTQKVAFVQYDECILRYSNKNFFSIFEDEPKIAMCNQEFVSGAVDKFTKLLRDIMENLTIKAANGKLPNGKKFAIETHKITRAQTIYSLVQCTPDLTVSDCYNCLQKAVDLMLKNCSGMIGGRVVFPSCNVRYEPYGINSNEVELPIAGEKGIKSLWIGVSAFAVLVVLLLSASIFYLCRRKEVTQPENRNSQEVQLLELGGVSFVQSEYSNENSQGESSSYVKPSDCPLIRLDIIRAATQHFSDDNKLGEGGFGPVYKGTLTDGKTIAVKRLSRTSGQGLQEFKNEATLIARLQHRNLVRLLGCCLEGNEVLLVYEFMPNKSLDVFLFGDSTRRAQLDWKRRLSIINGIARGLLYLHEDSRLRIIHRDLKASNILLDQEMDPKISDFGMARMFGGNQDEANTIRVVGTYGYMAPEYAMEGVFSVKSDVFSFGVLLLEILSGKRNGGFHLNSEHGQSLITFAWQLWCKGQGLELMDQLLVKSCVTKEVINCIHIGLLCVQGDPENRPTMSSVVVMLANDTDTIPQPTQPTFSIARRCVENLLQSTTNIEVCPVSETIVSNVISSDFKNENL